MKHVITVLMMFFSTALIAQDDPSLDEIFDDGKKDSKFFVGVKAEKLIQGTFNAYFEVQPFDMLRLNVGAGIIPFKYFLDLSNYRFGSFNELPLIDTDIGFGYHYSVGMKVFYLKNRSDLLDNFFIDINFSSWNYAYSQNWKVRRRKFHFGLFGYQMDLKGNFSANFSGGVFLGRDKIQRDDSFSPSPGYYTEIRGYSVDDQTLSRWQFIANFNLNFGVSYGL